MNDLPVDALDVILSIIDKNEISAYEIGNATGLNISGLNKIINRKTTKPQQGTIRIMWEYLQKRKLIQDYTVHEAAPSTVSEPAQAYKTLSRDEYIVSLENALKAKDDIIAILKEQIDLIKAAHRERE